MAFLVQPKSSLLWVKGFVESRCRTGGSSLLIESPPQWGNKSGKMSWLPWGARRRGGILREEGRPSRPCSSSAARRERSGRHALSPSPIPCGWFHPSRPSMSISLLSGRQQNLDYVTLFLHRKWPHATGVPSWKRRTERRGEGALTINHAHYPVNDKNCDQGWEEFWKWLFFHATFFGCTKGSIKMISRVLGKQFFFSFFTRSRKEPDRERSFVCLLFVKAASGDCGSRR